MSCCCSRGLLKPCGCGLASKACLYCKNAKKKVKITKKLVMVYTATFIAGISTAFSLTMVFPFLPFMVEFLLPWLLEDETQVATYTGIVASSVFIGRMLTGYAWGAVADRVGRKPVIITSLVLMGLSTGVFGLSVNYAMAFITRFLVGFTNGALGALKAVVSEVSDDSTQAFGVALFSSSFGFGLIIGPAVSGVISDPIGQYNLTIDNYVTREFLTRFPYSLPCFVNMILSLFSALMVFFLIPETLGVKKNRRRSEIHIPTRDDPNKTSNDSVELDRVLDDTNSDSTPLISEEELSDDPDTDQLDITTAATQHSTQAEGCHDSSQPGGEEQVAPNGVTDAQQNSDDSDSIRDEQVPRIETRRKSIKSSLKNHFSFLLDKGVILSVLLYSIFSFALIGYNEVLPVWAKTSPHLGGLGFSLSEIGLALTIAGILYLPFSIFLYPLLEKKLGSIKTCLTMLMIIIPFKMLLPNIHYLSQWKGLEWFLLISMMFITQCALGVAVSCSILLINNSVTFDKLGVVNGIAMTLTSLSRAVSPIVAGWIFSLSLQATQAGFSYPLDYRLVFLLFGITHVVCVLLVACMPSSINKQKIIEDLG